VILFSLVVHQEKTQQNLLHGVESFDKAALKPTETQEKIVLPDPEGNYFLKN
jgi:Thymosin beta-4 family